MKKFMIFLLMAFLYLGTCQARSESAHPNDGKLKLLSWVSPTPSQSFLTRTDEATFSITPNGSVYLGVSGDEGTKTFTVSSSESVSNVHYVWMLQKAGTSTAQQVGTGASYTVQNMNVGTYTLYCEVYDGNQVKIATTEPVAIYVAQHEFTVDIVGAYEACENDEITLTAQINANQLAGFRYQWYVNGEAPVGYVTNAQTFKFKPVELFGPAPYQNLSYEFTVEVSYEGCSHEVSAVHEFVVIPTPTVTLTVPEKVCLNEIPTYTAIVDGPAPYHYEWYVKNREEDSSVVATTTENMLAIAADSIMSVGVKALYQNAYCNSEIKYVLVPDTFEAPGKLKKVDIVNITRTPKDTLCVGEAVTFELTDTNTTFGDATYAWYVNGLQVEGITGKTYTANFEAVGTYIVTAAPTYANYPCTGDFSANDTVVITAAPAIAVSGRNVICEGDTAVLIASEGFQTYTWTGAGVPANFTKDTLKVTTAGVYTVSGVTKYGCASEEAEDITVQQFGGNLQVTATEYQVCPGTTVAVNANLYGWNNENITYKWSDNATGSLHEITPMQDTTVTVTAYAGTTTDTTCKMQQTITIHVIDEVLPQITLVPSTNQEVCLDAQVKVKVSNDVNYNGLYNWYYDGIEILGQHMDSITVTMVEAGDHFIAAKRANYVCGLDTMSAPVNVKVIELPALVVTGDNVICQNDTATLTATDIMGAKYLWAGPATIDANKDTLKVLKTFVPGVYSVKATKGGCETNTAMFAVQQLGGDLQVYASQIEVCPGTRVVLNANLDGYNNENISYAWTVKGQTTPFDTVATTSVVPAPAQGADSVVYTVTATAAEYCQMTANIAIYVIDTTPVNLTVNVLNENICQGGQVTATVQVNPVENNPTPVVNYFTWFINGHEVYGQNLDTLTFNLNEPGVYTIGAKPAAQRCVDQAVTMADKDVTVYAIPEVVVTGNNYICNGDTAKMTALAVGSEKYTYAWTGPVTSNDSALNTTEDGVYTVTATGKTSKCVATADVTIYEFGASMQVVADKMEVCAGEMVVLNANLNGFNNENVSYEWEGEGLVATTGSTVSAIPTVDNSKYVVTATAGNCTMTDSVIITVHEIPAAVNVVTVDREDICVGEQVTVEALNGSADLAYIWYQNGVVIPGQNANLITLNLNEPGAYTYAARTVNQYGCISNPGTETEVTTIPVTVDRDINIPFIGTYHLHFTVNAPVSVSMLNSDTVTVHAAPEFTLTGNNVVCNGDNAIITASNEDYTYVWSDADHAAENVFTSNVAGTYAVTATDEFECSTTATFEIVTFGADIQLTADKMEICEGEMVVLNANLDGFNNENISYEWEGEGLVATTGSTVSAIPTVDNSKYVVTATAGNCTMTDSVLITVHESPAAVVVTRVTDSIICTGNQATFQAVPASAEMSYIWFQNGVRIPGENMSTITLNMNEAGTYKYSVLAYNQYGCPSIINPDGSETITATGTYIYDTVAYHQVINNSYLNYILNLLRVPAIYTQGETNEVEVPVEVEIALSILPSDSVVVLNHPTVAITGDPMICETDRQVYLYANVNDTLGTMDYSYEWRLYNYTLDVNRPQHIDPNFTEEPIMVFTTDSYIHTGHLEAQDHPYVFTVVVTSEEGCRVESAPYYVYVGDTNKVVVTVDYDQVCAGGTVHARAHLGNYNMTDLTAQWEYRTQHSDGRWGRWHEIAAGMEGILEQNPENTTQYRITVTNAVTGCTSTSDPVTVTVVDPIVVARVVAVNAANNSTDVCMGAQLNVAAYILDEDGNEVIDNSLNYTWELNGIQLNDIHGPAFSAQAGIYDNDPVDYVYTVYVSDGIPGCYPVAKNSDTVHVKRNPIVTIDGNPNVCYKGRYETNVILLAWVNGVVDTRATYTWYESGHREANTLSEEINQYQASKAVTHDNPYIFTVEVVNGDGCTTISDPFYVNVYAAPVVNITGDQSHICTDGEVNLRASLNDYNDPLLTFQWFKNEVNNSHLIPGATHEFETFVSDTTTDYIVEVTHMMNAFHDQEYCVAYDTFHVEVEKAPEIHAINDLAGVHSICEGRNITFAVDTVRYGVSGGDVFTWYVNGQQVDNANSPVFVDSPVAVNGVPTQYVYQVSLRQAASACQSEIFSLEDTIMVYPQPALYIQTDPIVCTASDSNIMLVVNMDPTTIDTSANFTIRYNWFEDNAVISPLDTTGVLYLTRPYRDYPYNFSVQTVNEYGCISEASAIVYVNDSISIIPNMSDTAICLGGEIVLNANLGDWNADQLRYQWKDNGVNIPAGTTREFAYTPATAGEHIFTLNVEQMTSHCVANTRDYLVDVKTVPSIDTINNNIPANRLVCDGYQVELNAHVINGVAGGEVYTWYRNGNVIDGATEATYSEVVSALNGEPTDYVYEVSVVQTAAGCESDVKSLASFTVNPNPVVEIATDPIVCVDTVENVVLVANVYPSVEGVTFRWFEDNVPFTGVGQNKDTLKLSKSYSENPYNFRVELVNQYNCTASSEASVYVNAQPVVHVFASENNICKDGVITLNANLADWNADQLVYQWQDNGVDIEGATTLNYVIAPNVAGEHNYTLTVEQLTSGCVATSDSAKVQVNVIPVIDSVTISDYTVCYGAQLTITANVSNVPSNSIPVYTWYRNGILMEGATAGTILDAPGIVDNNTQYYVYTAVVTYPEAGCSSLPTVSDNVTVYANPRVQITGDQHVCETDSVFLIASVDTNGIEVGQLHYTWYESGQIRDNMGYGIGDRQFFAEYLHARTEPYIFSVDVWRDNTATGCIAHSQDFYVYVYTQPVVNITATDTTICTNGEVTLTANLNDYNADNITYQWYEVKTRNEVRTIGFNNLTGALIDSTFEVAYNEIIPGATSRTYTANYDHNATMGVLVLQTNTVCTAVDEINIFVEPIPVVSQVTVSDSVVCDGALVNVSATINPADAEGAVYTWFRNGQLIEGVNGASFSEHVFTTPDHVTEYTYSAIVTLPSSGCVSNMSTRNATVTVKNGPAEVYITGNNVICLNDSTTLTAHADVTGGTFTWNDGTIGATKVVKAGTYTVTYALNEGCTMTSAPFTVESFGTDLIVSTTKQNICRGEHTTLFVDQEGWNGNVTYNWDANVIDRTASTVDVQPDSTTTYHVTATVTNENGTCTAEGQITINVNQLPANLTIAATTDSVICEGNQVTLQATPNNEAGYIWYQNGVVIAGENQATLTVNFDEFGTYRFSAKAISDQGCESALASNEVTVTVNAAPESVVISGDLVICQGGSTTLTANVTPNVAGATYKWYKNNVVIANANDSVYVATEAGSYKVEATVNNCTTVSEPVVVTVAQAPQLELTATETTICAGGSTVITAEATGYNNVEFIYNWSNGYQGSVYTYENATVGAHKFIVTASQGTSGCVAVDSITINVNADPVAPIITVNGAATATICDSGQVNLVVTNPVEGAVYTWYRNSTLVEDSYLSTLTESPVTVDGDETQYDYTVIATLPMSGCGSVMSNTATVNVISTPVATVSVEGNTMFCEGGTTTLHANVAPVAGYTYQWYKDNVVIPGATAADYTVAEDARETAYNFKVEVSLHAGCTVTADAPAITVVADPAVTVNISNAISCIGGTATLTATVDGGVAGVNGLNGYTYAWYRQDLATVIGNTAEITVDAEVAGDYAYEVTVTSNYGCQTTSAPVHFSVVTDPVVTITRVAEYDATVCNGGTTALRANVVGGYGEATYQWYKNTNLLVGETNHVLVIDNLQAGNNDVYTVVVAQTGVGCEGSASAAINDLVTVNPAYSVSITGFGNVCEGGTLTLHAAVDGVIEGDAVTYQWYKVMNGHATPIEGASYADYSTSELLLGDSYEYFVMVNSIFSGCNIVSNTVPANVVAAPSVTISGANTVCEGGNLVLNAFVTGGVEGDDYIYTWNWTGAGTGTVTTDVPTFTPTISANDAAAPYYFTVTISRPNDLTGCTATSVEAHEVNVLAVPTVVVTADNAMVCENGQVTFTAHVSPVGTYNYVWIVNDQQQPVNANTVTYNATTAGTIAASVTVSAANASASCSASGNLAVPVQVVTVPTVTVGVDHDAMCVGGAVTLTVNDASFNNIPGELVYQWYLNGEALDGAVARQIVQTINNAGAYRYSVKVSSNYNIGCVSEQSVPVTVLVAEQPVVNLNSADGLAICEGGDITLTGVVTNYGNTINGVNNGTVYGNMTFDWTSNGLNVHHNTGVNNAMNQVTETLNEVGNYSYQVVVTPTGFNCQPQYSNIEVVNVVGNPSWTEVHVYSSNGADGCIGDMVMLNAEIVGGAFDFAGATGGHIQWIVSDGTNTTDVIGGLGGNSYDLPTAPGTYTYTPTFVGNIGSGCQLANNVAQRTITIHELPTAAFTSGDGTSICANDGSASAELVITFTGVAPFTYEVVDGNGNVVAAASTQTSTVSIYVAPSEQTTYRIVMVADAYCQNTALEADAMATVYVNNIEFSENFFESGCTDNGQVTIHFNMISGNPTAPFTVVYDNGMQVSGTISNNTATFATPTAPGDYNAIITIDGCDYAIVVRVLAGDYGFGGSLPIMDQRWNDVVVVNNNPATNGGHTFVGFQWYRNGVAIPGATYSNYQEIGGLNGFYSVELIERDAAGNMITYKTCEMYFNSVSTVKVYPVPANVRQEVTIELDLTAEELEGAVLDIYSVTGALINHMTDLKPITKVEGFKAQGTYFGRILTGTNEIKTVKFVIVK